MSAANQERDARWDRPSPARVYDYLLGGSANFAVDREFAEQALRAYPDARLIAHANRSFLRRAVRFCADAGIRQFLDLGSGVPTAGNVHDIVAGYEPACRVVYVDKDPVAVTHSRQLLGDTGDVGVIGADLADVEAVLADPVARGLLDPDRPVAVLAVAVLHYLDDAEDPAGVLSAYRRAFHAGGYVVLSHGTSDHIRELADLGELFERSTDRARLRTRSEVADLLPGLALVDPGLVYTAQWRLDTPLPGGLPPERSANYAAVAHFGPTL
ncbi:MAG: SAM-dependent methyltransferase [Actinocatenispora sp.]